MSEKLENSLDPIIIVLLKAAAFNPGKLARDIVIEGYNNQNNGSLRRITKDKNEVYVGLRTPQGKTIDFYLCDMPKEYISGIPTTVYCFNLDSN